MLCFAHAYSLVFTDPCDLPAEKPWPSSMIIGRAAVLQLPRAAFYNDTLHLRLRDDVDLHRPDPELYFPQRDAIDT